MPTLDMALFDWTDYEDLKPEVWPSAKKKGASTPLPPAPPTVGVGRGVVSALEWAPRLEMPLSRAYHVPNVFCISTYFTLKKKKKNVRSAPLLIAF